MATSAQDLLAANEKLSKESFAPLADEIDRPRRFPRQNIKKLGESRLLGLVVSREYGDVLKQKLLPAIARGEHLTTLALVWITPGASACKT